MNTSEKVASIAAGLYDMRRMLISIMGREKFLERVEAIKPLLAQVEKANNCNTLQAMQRLVQTESIGGDPALITQICAVAVEIMEPSKP
jgi:flagellar biosynthesis regulator FlbT